MSLHPIMSHPHSIVPITQPIYFALDVTKLKSSREK